jgi:hypothetical protein
MIRAVGDDGGLSDELGRIEKQRADEEFSREFSRDLDAENEQRELALVDEALAKQRPKVEAALTAFLTKAEQRGLEPTTILVGMHEPDPDPDSTKRFGLWRKRPQPTFEQCFEVHGLAVRVFRSGEVEFQGDDARPDEVWTPLPFHVLQEGGRPYGGSVPQGPLDVRLAAIANTGSTFVRWLAEYLADPPDHVSRWDDPAERAKLCKDREELRRSLPSEQPTQCTRPVIAAGSRRRTTP